MSRIKKPVGNVLIRALTISLWNHVCCLVVDYSVGFAHLLDRVEMLIMAILSAFLIFCIE